MAAKDAEKKIEALREKIRHHEHLYYVLDDPAISDAEFDKLMQQLKDLESEHPSLVTPDSPTQRVGGKPREGFVKVRHSTQMLSLDNTYNEEELRGWERRVHELTGRKDVDYVCELKLDGMSLALIYEDGRLARGVTRGDGSVGEDVTLNVRTVRSIPLSIPKERLKKAGVPVDFEVRGELLMPTASFKKINEEREKNGLPTFANPRNFTAGTVRQLDANITAERRMDFFPYILLENGRTYLDRHSKTTSWFIRWTKSGPLFKGGKGSVNRCRMRSMALWSKLTARRCRTNSVSRVKHRAGRSLTNMLRAAESRNWKTFAGRLAAPAN